MQETPMTGIARYPAPGDLPADHPDVVAGRHTNPAPPEPTSVLGHFDTDHLVRMRREMSGIPGDATSQAHIVAFIRSLISRELAHPGRVERDKQLAAQRAEEAKAKAEAELAARQEAEKAALVPAPTADELAAREREELDRKHAQEQAALARQHASEELAAKQAEERAALDGDASAGPGDDGVRHSAGPRFDPRPGGAPIR
jgi:hypothetical protein